jgi:hypothetical protein
MPTNVATLAQLKTAVADTGISAIAVTADIDVTSEVTCHRSTLTIDCGGHTLTNDCSSLAHKVFNFGSVSIDAGFVGIGQAGSPSRGSSLVTGTITAAGTTLQMHDEVVTLNPGDIVSIACGVNTSDPAEPAITLVMTVDHVTGPSSGTYTITFTAPFGVDVPTYTDANDLKAHTASSNYYKIQPTGSYGQWYNNDGTLAVSPWLTQANWTKGLGTKHGMTTFVGGVMNHNVTLKNGTLHTILPSDPHTVNSDFPLLAGDVFGFTFQDFTINNVFGNVFQATRSHNQTITGITITGTGVASGGGVTFYANGFGSWGGTGQAYSNITWDHTKNINGFNYEVEENDVAIDGMDFDTIEFDPTGIDNSSANFVFGLFTAADPNTVTNITFSKKAGTSVTWTGFGQTTAFSNVSFGAQATVPATLYVGDVLGSPATEDWTAGGFTIDDKLFNAATTVSKTGAAAILVPANNGSTRWIRMPRGVYLSMRLRLTTVGSCTDIYDPLGNHYPTTLNLWTSTVDGSAGHSWGTLQANSLWTDYEDGTHAVSLSFTGNSAAIIEIEATYLPLNGHSTSRDWLVVDPPVLTAADDTGGGSVGHTDNAIAFYDLDSDANDDSGNGKNGTNHNGVTFDGTRATFDSDAYITLPTNLFSSNVGTVSAWVSAGAVDNYYTIFSIETSTTDAMELIVEAADQAGGLLGGAYFTRAKANSVVMVAGVLTHVAVVSDGVSTKLYVNGVHTGVDGTPLFSTFSAAGAIGARADGSLSFGSGGGTSTIRSVAVYSDAKDPTWMTEEFNSGTPQKWADWQAPQLVAGTLAELVHGSTTASLTYATVTGGTAPYSNQLRRSLTSGSGYSNVESPVVGNTASYNETGLTPATGYYYVVTSTDGDSNTVTSNEVHVTTNAVLSAGTLSQSSVGSTTAALSYATVSGGVSTYSNQLKRSLVSGSGYANVGSAQVGTTASFSDSGLTASTSYYYVVVSTDNESSTVTSNEVHVTTAAPPLVTPSKSIFLVSSGQFSNITGQRIR